MNIKDYVSLETSILLKDKGFNEPCICFYCKMYDSIETTLSKSCRFKEVTYNELEEGDLLIPSLYQAQKWLREKCNIHIIVGNSASGFWFKLSKANNGTNIYEYNYNDPNDGGNWYIYEESLNAGILKALKFI